MLGAITGDIIGSVYEWNNIKTKDFELFSPECFFTDDSVLTIALAYAIMADVDYGQIMRDYYNRYAHCSYGGRFRAWVENLETEPYNSWGNGSAMRTSPVGFVYDNLDDVLKKAKHFASFTHNHPEGIKGAQVTSTAIYLARTGAEKKEIKKYIVDKFKYDLTKTLDQIRPSYKFDVSCQGTVPQAITAFLESNSYEDAIRNAISLGGDSDTLACITGGIAEAYYGALPNNIADKTKSILDDNLNQVVDEFYRKLQ